MLSFLRHLLGTQSKTQIEIGTGGAREEDPTLASFPLSHLVSLIMSLLSSPQRCKSGEDTTVSRL